MPDVFTRAKRSEAGPSAEFGNRSSERGSEFLEVEIVAADAEVFDDAGNDAAGHVARMPRKRDEAVRAEGRVKGFASRGGEHRTSNIQHPIEGKRANLPGVLRNLSPFGN